MKDFQKKNKFKNMMQTKPFLIFLGLIVLFFSFNMFVFLGKMNNTVNKKELVENKVNELEATKEKLGNDIERLKTDRGIEESIREKFGFAEEGEELIIIIDKPEENIEKSNENKGFFEFIKNWFK